MSINPEELTHKCDNCGSRLTTQQAEFALEADNDSLTIGQYGCPYCASIEIDTIALTGNRREQRYGQSYERNEQERTHAVA